MRRPRFARAAGFTLGTRLPRRRRLRRTWPNGCRKSAGRFCRRKAKSPPSTWCTARRPPACAAMTSSSSPGISLKSEGLSYMAGADLPALVVNVQRGGPGLGGIQPSQADYFQATKGGGHGDYHMIVLAPASVQEMADLTVKAFDAGRPVPHDGDDPGRRHHGPDDGAGVARSCEIPPVPDKPGPTTGTQCKAEAQHHQFAVR